MSKKKETTNAEHTEVAVTSGFMQLANTNIGEMITEELDGLDAGFERIKIPSAGSITFEMPGEDPSEPDAVKEFSAVILFHHPLHAFYRSKYTGGNNPPDCGSFDGVIGEGDPGGECKRCPYNQFGSGENGAKACKNRRRIFVLREGEIFPLLLSLPTGSLREFTRYLKRLLSKGRKSNSVVTRFSLKKATNSGGIAYSQAQFALDRELNPEEHGAIEKLSEQIRAYSKQVAFDYDSAGFAEDGGVNIDPETGEIIEPLNGGN
jgi:hypothetical protein